MVRANTLVEPPGRGASAASVPSRPLAASLTVPSPPSTTTASTPSLPPCGRQLGGVVAVGGLDHGHLVAAPAAPPRPAAALAFTRDGVRVDDEQDELHPSVSSTLVLARRGPELGQAAGQQAGDVHLADAQPGRDLGLGEPLEEAQVQDRLLPRAGSWAMRGDRATRCSLSIRPWSSSPSWARQRALVVAGGRRVERGEPVGVAGFDGLEHLLLRDLGLGAISGMVGERPSSWRERAHHRAQPEVQLLHAAGHPHGPALVPEVAL